MINSKFIYSLFMILLICSCAKEELNEVSTKIDQTITTPQVSINFPDFSDVEFDIPKIEVKENLSENNSITLSPGTNQLQNAINSTSKNGTITLQPGTYHEDITVVVNKKVKIIGQNGATVSLGGTLGLVVQNTSKVTISNITFTNSGNAVLGIGVNNANHVKIENNDVIGFAIGIMLDESDHTKIHNNYVYGTNPGADLGITIVNGRFASVRENECSNNVFGIWACDEKGIAKDNILYGNTIGLILCNVPASDSPFGSGGSDVPATDWNVMKNNSYNNVWGYLVIDGSTSNTLMNNKASNNLLVDMELAAVTNNLFGFTTPISKDNKVILSGESMSIIDCGQNNTIIGGPVLSGPCSE